MIIDRKGNILSAAYMREGIIVKDGIFSVFLEYEKEEYKEKKAVILSNQKKLNDTDYMAIKYAEGALTDEEYEAAKAQRKAWRKEINDMEAQIVNPTITREELDTAEAAAREKLK